MNCLEKFQNHENNYDYENFCNVVKTESKSLNNNKEHVDDIIKFFKANEKHLNGNFIDDRNPELGDDILKLSKKIRRTYPNEIRIKGNEIRKITKMAEIFGFSRKVLSRESLGNFEKKDTLSLVLRKLKPEVQKEILRTSKGFQETLKRADVILHTINRNPKKPLTKYGIRTLEEIRKFIGDYKEKIEVLNLEGLNEFKIKPEQLKELIENCTNLKHLFLDKLELVDQNEVHIEFAKATSLETLVIFNASGINAKTLEEIKKCTNLQTLELLKCSLADEEVKILGEHLKKLNSFSLSYNDNITGDGIQKLSNLKNLTLFKCENIKNKQFKKITKLPLLQKLRIPICQGITDNGLTSISKMEHLEDLDLSLTGLSKEGVALLTKLPLHLKNLGMQNCYKLGKEDLKVFFQYLPKYKNLEELRLTAYELSDNDLLQIAQLLQLRTLKLDYWGDKITGEGIKKFIEKLSELKFLKKISLRNNELSDQDLIAFAKLPLKSIDLNHCTGITEKGTRVFKEGVKVLF